MMPPAAQLPFVPPFNASVPNFGIPPPFAAAWNNPQWQAHGPNVNDSKIDPKILARASEWTEHRAPDGRPYYYCAANGTSVWERPQVLKELDEARMAFMTLQHPPPNMHHPHLHQPMISTQGNVMFDSSGNMIKPDALMNKQHLAEMEAEKERKRREAEKKKADEAAVAAAKQPAKPQDKTRPISSTPIAGTPWAVVWTGDSRVFFYNPSTRTSVWERPEDLVGKSFIT
jgi:transcription elongation regulator 1